MLILVTGATGFIGNRLVAGLSGAGHQVIALVRKPAKVDMLPLPITLITSLDQLPADTKVDAVVNLAGEPDTSEYEGQATASAVGLGVSEAVGGGKPWQVPQAAALMVAGR